MNRLYKIFVVLIVVFSVCYSLLYYGFYAYNEHKYFYQLKHYQEEVNEYPEEKKGELLLKIQELQYKHPNYKKSEKEWGTKLIIDFCLLFSVITFLVLSPRKKNS